MSRRSRGRTDALAKTQHPAADTGRQGPSIRDLADPLHRPVPPPQVARPAWENTCPTCGADVSEVGGLGCCGAEVASCEGAIDGVRIDFDANTFTDEEIDERAEYHYWYIDTGRPAPAETGGSTIPCRCQRAG
jgi:hypothetical protein